MTEKNKRTIVVTGAKGFIGSNLVTRLREREEPNVVCIDIDDDEGRLFGALDRADIVYHLAGVNRPQDPREFESGNHGLTAKIVVRLSRRDNPPVIVATSSIQVECNNPYGQSKRAAEDELFHFSKENHVDVFVYRLPNVFGKWSRPFYNSAVATFCHQVAHGEAPSVHDPAAPLHLVYIDDVIDSLVGILDNHVPSMNDQFCTVAPVLETTVGQVANIIQAFPRMRSGGTVPDFSDPLAKRLYATYLTYLSSDTLEYQADVRRDDRGYLFELVKSDVSGQLFVSRTKPGVTRGNHYHHSKVEKFCVVEGSAEIRLRHLVTQEAITIPVSGVDCRVVDIPPGYTHQISNIGETDLITLFWANEVFSPDNPDTHFEEV